MRDGLIGQGIGDVTFTNFMVADNMKAGMEISTIDSGVEDGLAKIIDGIVVGRSANTNAELDAESPSGIITPRTERFTVTGTKFYNFK